MWKALKRFLVGAPISTAMAHHERINNKTALAVFSSDALSSVAYSTEAILLVLLAAGSVAMGYLPHRDRTRRSADYPDPLLPADNSRVPFRRRRLHRRQRQLGNDAGVGGRRGAAR